jgi:hypothetical protein
MRSPHEVETKTLTLAALSAALSFSLPHELAEGRLVLEQSRMAAEDREGGLRRYAENLLDNNDNMSNAINWSFNGLERYEQTRNPAQMAYVFQTLGEFLWDNNDDGMSSDEMSEDDETTENE